MNKIKTFLFLAAVIIGNYNQANAQTTEPPIDLTTMRGTVVTQDYVDPLPVDWDPSLPWNPYDPRINSDSWLIVPLDTNPQGNAFPPAPLPIPLDLSNTTAVVTWATSMANMIDFPSGDASRGYGAMGWSWLNIKQVGPGQFQVEIGFACNPAWTLQNVSGGFAIEIWDPMTNQAQIFHINPVAHITFADNTYTYTSKVFKTRPGTVAIVVGAFGGIGYTSFVGIRWPAAWMTPVLRKAALIL